MTLPPAHPFWTYSQAVLPYAAPLGPEAIGAAPLDAPGRERALSRLLRAVERGTERGPEGNQTHLLLLGLGEGILVRELFETLPPGVRCTVLEPAPQRVHHLLERSPHLLDWWSPTAPMQLLADSSPWAALLLLHAWEGLEPLLPLRNPEAAGHGRTGQDVLQRLLTVATSGSCTPNQPSASKDNPSLSVAAILRPDEPGLEAFFAQIPVWCREVVVIWDAERPPRSRGAVKTEFRELARPLHADFAAQRNAMLRACHGDWVLYLDADERLSPEVWEHLRLCIQNEDVHGFWLPRQTLYPDAGHCMAGLGLWPDLQLRLFRNAPGPHFVNPVHERLAGLEGATAILPGLPMVHLNQLLKSPEEIEEKYRLFQRAGGVRHARSASYPCLPLAFFEAMQRRIGQSAAILTGATPLG
jgi:hypothetical protein